MNPPKKTNTPKRAQKNSNTSPNTPSSRRILQLRLPKITNTRKRP